MRSKKLSLLASALYELILLVALWLILGAIFTALFGGVQGTLQRFGLQIFLWLITGFYFVWQWQKNGQTLPAQTWSLKLVQHNGEVLSWQKACVRYVLATLSFAALGLGFWWVLLDKENRFWHDSVLKTRFLREQNRKH